MKDDHAKIAETVILGLWDSLQSHMEWTHKASSEGKAFHRKCVQEYAEQIYLIGKQL